MKTKIRKDKYWKGKLLDKYVALYSNDKCIKVHNEEQKKIAMVAIFICRIFGKRDKGDKLIEEG